ncbi:hypothetical protein [Cupriavidus sp. UME77]|uniref:hypothetical protein n=1 Tax=Cupriavidus sp. UME77 TaxID=1862321 RepID=UPI00210204B2|nr:hypothetical protein [Cupriavidus sp. UME77]
MSEIAKRTLQNDAAAFAALEQVRAVLANARRAKPRAGGNVSNCVIAGLHATLLEVKRPNQRRPLLVVEFLPIDIGLVALVVINKCYEVVAGQIVVFAHLVVFCWVKHVKDDECVSLVVLPDRVQWRFFERHDAFLLH